MKRRIEKLDGPARFADRVGVMLGFMGLALGGAMAATLFGPWVVIGGVFASLVGVMVWLVAMLFEGSEKCEVIAELMHRLPRAEAATPNTDTNHE